MSLAASKVVLEELRDGKVQEYLHSAGKQLSKNFEAIVEDLKIEARLQTFAGKFQVYFTDHEVTDYRTAISCDEQKYLKFQGKMFSSGILMWPSYTLHHGITAAHTNEDITTITKAMENALTEVKRKTGN
jgi:glutamate-1-semialdehyde 2,1-aminomutase